VVEEMASAQVVIHLASQIPEVVEAAVEVLVDQVS
jgi:hypothetical protein